jgi:hypothetical protein
MANYFFEVNFRPTDETKLSPSEVRLPNGDFLSQVFPNFSPILSRHVPFRVARLGEFSPLGRLFTMGSLFEDYKSGTNFMLLFIKMKFRHLFWLCKHDWATFWAIFSQTLVCLVTLMNSSILGLSDRLEQGYHLPPEASSEDVFCEPASGGSLPPC